MGIRGLCRQHSRSTSLVVRTRPGRIRLGDGFATKRTQARRQSSQMEELLAASIAPLALFFRSSGQPIQPCHSQQTCNPRKFHIQVYTHICIYIHIHIYTYIYIYIHIYIYTYIYIYIHTHTHIYIYIYIYAKVSQQPLLRFRSRWAPDSPRLPDFHVS